MPRAAARTDCCEPQQLRVLFAVGGDEGGDGGGVEGAEGGVAEFGVGEELGGDDAAGDADEVAIGIEDGAAAVAFGEGGGGADDGGVGVGGVEGGDCAGGDAAVGGGPVAGREEDDVLVEGFAAEFEAEVGAEGEFDEGDVALGKEFHDAEDADGGVADGEGGGLFEAGGVGDEAVGGALLRGG